MSHLHESWKLHDWRFPHRSTSTGCRKLPKSTTSSTARVLRPKEDPNQDLVAAVVVIGWVNTPTISTKIGGYGTYVVRGLLMYFV